MQVLYLWQRFVLRISRDTHGLSRMAQAGAHLLQLLLSPTAMPSIHSSSCCLSVIPTDLGNEWLTKQVTRWRVKFPGDLAIRSGI